MKRIIFLTLIALMAGSYAQAKDLKWLTWNEGYELAKKENKPMLVFVHATWCNMCKRLEEKTFNDESVAAEINEKFIPVKLNPEEKAEYLLNVEKVGMAKILSTLTIDLSKGLAVPTTVLWKVDTKKANVFQGLLDPDEMKKALASKIR